MHKYFEDISAQIFQFLMIFQSSLHFEKKYCKKMRKNYFIVQEMNYQYYTGPFVATLFEKCVISPNLALFKLLLEHYILCVAFVIYLIVLSFFSLFICKQCKNATKITQVEMGNSGINYLTPNYTILKENFLLCKTRKKKQLPSCLGHISNLLFEMGNKNAKPNCILYCIILFDMPN